MMKLVDGKLVDLDDADIAQAQADAQRANQTAPGITYKGDLWRRCSEAEADILDAALDQSPSRLRRLFDDAQYLDPSDPDYPTIRAAVVTALGEARAAEVLAPS